MYTNLLICLERESGKGYRIWTRLMMGATTTKMSQQILTLFLSPRCLPKSFPWNSGLNKKALTILSNDVNLPVGSPGDMSKALFHHYNRNTPPNKNIAAISPDTTQQSTRSNINVATGLDENSFLATFEEAFRQEVSSAISSLFGGSFIFYLH